MRINREQQTLLERLKCVRLNDGDESLLSTISCPKINGMETGIDELFRTHQELEANRDGKVASYLVVDHHSTRQPVVLMFFSIRAGELFRQSIYTSEQIELASDMLHAFSIFERNKDALSSSEIVFLLKIIKKAKDKGIDIDNAKAIVKFHESYIKDTKKEPSEGVNRVLDVFSGIELKLFGINDNAKDHWDSFKLPRSMGETLFWSFLIPKIAEARSLAGIEYLYLFAADNTPDGRLINYYQSRLHLNCDEELSTNKPHFDYQCRFLYQRIDELLRRKEDFFQNFTIDNPI